MIHYEIKVVRKGKTKLERKTNQIKKKQHNFSVGCYYSTDIISSFWAPEDIRLGDEVFERKVVTVHSISEFELDQSLKINSVRSTKWSSLGK